jgi:hypothetical protein
MMRILRWISVANLRSLARSVKRHDLAVLGYFGEPVNGLKNRGFCANHCFQ